MSDQSFVATVVVWLTGKDDPSEEYERVVTVNDDAYAETGDIEISQETNKGNVYLRVKPEILLQAILALRFNK